jgi:eukaryotic-like serine/threonine-protein kinase
VGRDFPHALPRTNMDANAEALNRALSGRYTVERELGSGGMATVYLARDIRHERDVAIKVLRPELASTIAAERFLREIRLTAQLNHPHILPLLDSGDAEGLLYYVMPAVEGESLREKLDRETAIPVEASLRIAREVADALDHAHRRGVVHRDIKPDNILLQDGHARVADFGIAQAVEAAGGEKLTATGLAVGTPHYMSPEQAGGAEKLDGRSDIYSLGCVLYEMLAGQPPFTGSTVNAIVRQHLAVEPPPIAAIRSSVPAPAATAVHRALAKSPADRFGTSAEFAAALSDSRPVSPEGRSRRFLMPRAVAALLLLGLAIFASARGGLFPGREQPAAPAGAITSVAVLPFANLSAAPDDEFMADGLTEDIINALARLPGLKVVSRTSTFAFKGAATDVRDIARRLDVESVVEGSVRRVGNTLRVTAQLISARNGYQVWSDDYERDVSDVFVVQNEIATAIASSLRTRFVPGEPLIAAPTRSLEAYELYLRGRHFSGLLWTRENLNRSLAYHQQAIAADPAFAAAYAGLAETYSMMDHATGRPLERDDEYYERAITAAEQAIRLDFRSAEAHAALGHIFLHQGRFSEADRHLARALELNPGSATAHLWRGIMLKHLLRTEQSIQALNQARALDPLSPQAARLLARSLADAGHFDSAAAAGVRGLEVTPGNVSLVSLTAEAHALAGRHSEALSLLDRAATLPDPDRVIDDERALLLALAGRRDEAVALLRSQESAPLPQRRLQTVAKAYAAAGDTDEAVRRFEQLIRRGANYARLNLAVPQHPAFDALRTDPRYHELRRSLGLPTDGDVAQPR